MLSYTEDLHIHLPAGNRRIILEHCQRALEAFERGEAEKGKAFGLLFGSRTGDSLKVASCFPLERNVRSKSPYKEFMDKVMAEHAVPSVTPLEKRGWVADPAELFARIREGREKDQVLLGTYHMHRVGWKHDRKRDTPTRLDTVLAEESGLLMFIISMVDPALPVIRAFYEGIREQEIPIYQTADSPA